MLMSIVLLVVGTLCCLLPPILWRMLSLRTYDLVHFSIQENRSQTELAPVMKLAIVAVILLWIAASINIILIGDHASEEGMTPHVVLVLGWFLTGYISMSLVFLQKHRRQFSIQATATIVLIYSFAIFVIAGNLMLFFGAVIEGVL